jgi:hypothetical protein
MAMKKPNDLGNKVAAAICNGKPLKLPQLPSISGYPDGWTSPQHASRRCEQRTILSEDVAAHPVDTAFSPAGIADSLPALGFKVPKLHSRKQSAV